MSAAVIGGVIITGYGIINCFFGQKFFRILLGIWGFLLGGALGISLTADAAPLVILIAGVLGALLGTVLIYFIFRLGLFLIGAILGYALTAALLTSLGIVDNQVMYAVAGGAFFGVLSLLLRNFFVVLITAFSGASAIVTGVMFMLNGERMMTSFMLRQFSTTPETPSTMVAVFWLLLAIAGMLIQHRSLRSKN